MGVVNFYLCMWPRQSHTLAPLTKIIPNKIKLKWAKIEQDAFNEIKRIVARNKLSTHLDFNEEPKIHTDASKFQLVAFIIQKVKPTAFHSIQLTDSQTSYKVTEG